MSDNGEANPRALTGNLKAQIRREQECIKARLLDSTRRLIPRSRSRFLHEPQPDQQDDEGHRGGVTHLQQIRPHLRPVDPATKNLPAEHGSLGLVSLSLKTLPIDETNQTWIQLGNGAKDLSFASGDLLREFVRGAIMDL